MPEANQEQLRGRAQTMSGEELVAAFECELTQDIFYRDGGEDSLWLQCLREELLRRIGLKEREGEDSAAK